VWKHVIGIVGGLGPFAHLELERLLLQATARRGERPLQDQDFPSWLLASIPATPDRGHAIEGACANPNDALLRALAWLEGPRERRGADFAVLACNSAHGWLRELRARSRLPILDVVAEALQEARRRAGDGARIGVLATTAGLRTYAATCAAMGGPVSLVSPLDLDDGEALQEELVMTPIYGPLRDGLRQGGGIKSGALAAARAPLARAVSRLGEAGASLVLTACSEIPLVLGRESIAGVPLLDPMEVAAEASVAIAAGERPLPRAGPPELRPARRRRGSGVARARPPMGS